MKDLIAGCEMTELDFCEMVDINGGQITGTVILAVITALGAMVGIGTAIVSAMGVMAEILMIGY